jgi:ABC-type antimicrobial peptide transport system permease subunit
LYGVIAYSTAQRTTEFGVRMAIGAQQSDVVRLVIGAGVRLSAIGVGLGLLGAYWASRLISAFLYQVSPNDFGAFSGSAVAMMIIALIAAYIPAARAARVDPAVALRSE